MEKKDKRKEVYRFTLSKVSEIYSLKVLKNEKSASASSCKPAQVENADDAPAGPSAPAQNQPAPQIIHQQILNWSHFKPEFVGRPDEDVEAHLLHTNDWMMTHNFQNDVKVQVFLTLVGEARLWYESLTPIANDWPAL